MTEMYIKHYLRAYSLAIL